MWDTRAENQRFDLGPISIIERNHRNTTRCGSITPRRVIIPSKNMGATCAKRFARDKTGQPQPHHRDALPFEDAEIDHRITSA